MTTAHRPTWAPAKGGEEQGGQRIYAPSRMASAKDQASHTKLKFSDMQLLENGLQEAGKGKMLVPKAIDADDEDNPSPSDDDSDGDEDDEAELLAELERIKKEREEAAAKRADEEASAAASSLQEELIRGNPLIIGKFDKSADFQVRKRWDDDVVFRNQERGEVKAQKRYINDTIRNDFHRRFLNRYIK
ncbi:Cwf15/Cwc15 cell cycle control protein [Coccomyxa subellipsoidea C-169]|uniref:Cwf15/Cwc15 cell cycle control protein n=1 Tax=Coccomyxa subellipsoidea (strain C-169) TaxID=574566 RepID=I0YRE3_COCSC|nr:Cwf15/Cwc15 cell cycle control protein [Coccomyxa subellipsoidea C-169]EIE20962.1 Cwf15/Cwc15 cell cycle control protein [Coccomyxa subellipsoidea C-169]|eukprot:XP_005645506.1 Cwf15/Cwc15 cell cycle control protein [Coccomyxa subellipsoidea C-169]